MGGTGRNRADEKEDRQELLIAAECAQLQESGSDKEGCAPYSELPEVPSGTGECVGGIFELGPMRVYAGDESYCWEPLGTAVYRERQTHLAAQIRGDRN